MSKVNGIDVSECRFYEPKAQKMTCHEETITKPCESTPICYYKLLQKSYIEIQRLQEEYEGLKKRCEELDKMTGIFSVRLANKYKQALKEIREIAKYNQFYNPKYFMLRGDIGQIQNIKMAEIYEKCNEALNDRD